MALILDANALSALADGDDGSPRSIGVGIGCSRHRARYEEWLRATLRLLLVLRVSEAAADAYAEIRAELKAAGSPIPTNDLWIAALAREHGWPLATRDRHFAAVRGLRLADWVGRARYATGPRSGPHAAASALPRSVSALISFTSSGR
jgi:predicted nucleic acid-binding protein